jgi:hypothetical protein
MKKIFTTLAMAAFAMTSFAQSTQQYWRVEFDMPIVNDGSGKTSVASGMKDDYTYCNPEHQYLDFQANGTLTARGQANPMGFRSTTTMPNENSFFYLENGRTAQYNTSTHQEAYAKYPYQVDHITKITTYSIPVMPVQLIDSTTTHEYTYMGNDKTYRVAEFTFNRLPRNVAELKTLMEDSNGNRVAAAKNPLFVAAVMYLVCPRLLDYSQDCRDMIDFLFGTQYSQLNTYGISNNTFQDICIGTFGGVDYAGFPTHNNLFQYFAGATPSNQYKPNGRGYGYDNGPYTVRVGWSQIDPLTYSGQMKCDVANLILFPNPEATNKDDASFDEPTAHAVKLRSTNKNGWFFLDGERQYFSKGKDQYDTSF